MQQLFIFITNYYSINEIRTMQTKTLLSKYTRMVATDPQFLRQCNMRHLSVLMHISHHSIALQYALAVERIYIGLFGQ